MKKINSLLCKLLGHISVDNINEEDAKRFLDENPEEKVGIICVRCGKKLILFY